MSKLQKLDELYTELENNKPPETFNAGEAAYNNGFYQGQLKALELVCVRVFDLEGGDQLSDLASKKSGGDDE